MNGPFDRGIACAETLMELTASIAAAFLCKNTVAVSDIPLVISSTHAALSALGEAPAAPVATKPEPKFAGAGKSWRRSVTPGAIISLIDGRRYKMLRRHLTNHGYTPESYRAAFDLPANYPMVAPDYAETRRQLALKIGLGRKPGQR